MTKTTVLYNDECPICSFEIKHYDTLAKRDGLPLVFDPLTTSAADWGIDRETAAKRIHVRHDGQVLDGVPAFIAMWTAMPKYRWLARLVSLTVVNQIAVAGYDYVAAPLLYKLHKRRQRRTVTQGND